MLHARYFNKKPKNIPALAPNYNLCPTQSSPIIFEKEGERQLELMRWGLIPFWAKDVKSASRYSLINARGEEVESKRSYKEAFKSRRCIVPVSGFFEWIRPEKAPKRPFAISMADGGIMSIAGIWERWESKDETIDSFAMITVEANKFMAKIHDRMPLILSKETEATWMSPETNIKDIRAIVQPCPDKWLTAYEISPKVNSPKNNSKDILDPLAS